MGVVVGALDLVLLLTDFHGIGRENIHGGNCNYLAVRQMSPIFGKQRDLAPSRSPDSAMATRLCTSMI